MNSADPPDPTASTASVNPDSVRTVPPAAADPQNAATISPSATTAAASTARPSVPGYELLGELGRGGMGVVYQARHLKLDRIVALKMILGGGHAGPADLARFQTEAQAIARLQHANIVQVYEVGEHEGQPFFSLEFCAGGSLAQKLNGTPLPAREAAALVETLAWAMQAAHEQHIIHRDLKPANVLFAGGKDCLPHDRVPKITDFGLAKKLDEAGQTQSGAIMGTPSYMAPEQAGGRSDAIGPAADVYALGAILYECLTGRPPFKASTAVDTILQVMSDEPVPPSRLQTKTPRDLETICLKCLQKAPRHRYGTARELADDLRRFDAGEPIQARPVGRIERARKWARRRPALAGLFVTLALTAIAATVGALLFTNELRWERDRARDERAEAETARGRADQRERQARLNLYVARMGLAQSAWRENQVGQVVDILRSLAPAGPHERDHRGFEWYFLWNQCHAERLRLEHPSALQHLLWSADGRYVVTACMPMTAPHDKSSLFCWDAQTGKSLWKLSDLPTLIRALAIRTDGSHVISVQRDAERKRHFVVTYQIASGKEVRRSSMDAPPADAMALSPDGQWLAFLEGVQIRLWDIRTEKKVGDIHLVPDVADAPWAWGLSPRITFSPDGKRLAACLRGGSQVVVVDRESGKQVDRLAVADDVTAMAFDQAGMHLAVGGPEGMIRRWQQPSQGTQPLLLGGHSQPVHGLAFSPDGRMLASAGQDQTVRCWNLSTVREVNLWRAHRSGATHVAFRPDGKQLASASLEPIVKIWDVGRQPGVQQLFAGQGFMAQVAMNATGQRLIGALSLPGPDEAAPVNLWSVAKGQLPERLAFQRVPLRAAEAVAGSRIAIAIRGEDNLLVQARTQEPHAGEPQPDQSIRVTTLRLDTGAVEATFLLAMPGRVSGAWAQLSLAGRLLAVSQNDRTIAVWDLSTRKPIATCKGVAPSVECLAFSSDGKWLAAAGGNADGSESEVLVWDALTGKRVLSIPGLKGHYGGLLFRDDGRLLAMAQNVHVPEQGMTLGQVVFWDMEQGKVVRRLQPQRLPVVGMAFSRDGQRFATGGLAGIIRVFELENGGEVLSIPTTAIVVYSLAFGPDDQYLVAGCNMREEGRQGTTSSAVLVFDGTIAEPDN